MYDNRPLTLLEVQVGSLNDPHCFEHRATADLVFLTL